MNDWEKHLKELPDVVWEYKKDIPWPNDRIVIGPFTTPKKDLQNDRVLLTAGRLDYIFKYGHLIKEHHRDKSEPVIIEGDCLAIGYDSMGKTYACWGFYDGTETIDEEWTRVVEIGRDAGFSIGGKIPTWSRVCSGSDCQLIDPEVLEVSWTKYPANQGATVHYINQFAKSMAKSIAKGNDTFEVQSAIRRMEKRLNELFSTLPEEMPDYDKFSNYPCVKDYTLALIETGISRPEAESIVATHIENLREGVLKRMEQPDNQTTPPVEKATETEGDIAPAPANQSSEQGNKVLELLEALVVEIKGMRGELELLKPKPEPMAQDPASDGEVAPPPAEEPEKKDPETAEKSEVEEPSDDEKKPEEDEDDKEDSDTTEKTEAESPEVPPSPPPDEQPMKKSLEVPKNLVYKAATDPITKLVKEGRLIKFSQPTRPQTIQKHPISGLPLDEEAKAKLEAMPTPTQLAKMNNGITFKLPKDGALVSDQKEQEVKNHDTA